MANKIRYIALTAAILMAACVFGGDMSNDGFFICADQKCSLEYTPTLGGAFDPVTVSLGDWDERGWYWCSSKVQYTESAFKIVKQGYFCDWYTLASDSTRQQDDSPSRCTILIAENTAALTNNATLSSAAHKMHSPSGLMMLYVKLKPVQYTVAFDANGGDGSMAAESMTYDTDAALIANKFYRNGYVFAGWATSESGPVEYADKQSVKNLTVVSGATVTLYAKWTPIAYAIRFVADGGSGSMADEAMVYDVEKALTANSFTRIGYTFSGWGIGESGSAVYADKALVKNLTTSPDSVVYLHAKWKPNSYKITFDQMGGSGGTAEVSVAYGSPMPAANMPTRTGYTFAGYWDVDAFSGGNKYYNADGSSAHDWNKVEGATLYARWSGNTYKVKFDGNGGTNSVGTVNAVYGEAMPAIAGAVSRVGYVFAGFYDQRSGGSQYYAADFSSVRNFDKAFETTLYAQWTVNKLTVTFDANGGNAPSPVSKPVSYDSTYGDLASCTRTGYTFGGWYTAASGGTKIESTTKVAVTVNQTLYAHWIAKSFRVTFNANGGNAPSSGSKSVTYDSTYGDLASCTRTGYTFGGWYTAASGGTKIETTTKVAITADQTLFAHWTAKTFTVTFNANGGNTPSPVSKSVTYDSTYGSLPSCARTGYTFGGWYTAASGGTKIESTTKVAVTVNQTLYAHWTAKTFTVTFNANGGNAPSSGSKSVTYDSTYGTLASCTRTGYKFSGWYTAASGGAKVDTTTKVAITANQTLFAHWTANKYSVVFKANGAGGTMAAQSFSYGESKALSLNAFVMPNQEFCGWRGSDGKSYTDGQVVSNLSSTDGETVTMTAQWSENSYVRFVAEAAEGKMDLEQFDGDEGKALTPNAYSRTGYTFDYWTNKTGIVFADAQYITNTLYVAHGETNVLNAVWSNNVYTIALYGNGATNSMSPVTAVYDVPLPLKNTFKHPDGVARFLGWGLSADTLEYPLDAGKDYATVSNLTAESGAVVVLYARWSIDYGPLSAALDCDNLKFVSDEEGGKDYWVVEHSAEAGHESYVIQKVDGSMHRLYARGLQGPGSLSFYVKTGKEEVTLYVKIDDVDVESVKSVVAGEWFRVNIRLPEMKVNQVLSFEHDYYDSYFNDYCAIDHLTWTPDHVDPVDPPAGDGAYVIKFATPTGLDTPAAMGCVTGRVYRLPDLPAGYKWRRTDAKEKLYDGGMLIFNLTDRAYIDMDAVQLP